jgi:tetratricopeptide (TPR) repeat protein
MSFRVPVLAFAAFLALASGAAAQDPAPDRARLERVRTLYGDKEQYPAIVDQLRELLGDSPDWSAARRDLARVLAWSKRYPESLAEYEKLIAAAPDDLDLKVEAAETASWSGDYARARRGLEAVLEIEPENQRALLALARCERWSGQIVRADHLYRQRLALESTPELEKEWRALYTGHGPSALGRARTFSDKGGFTRYDVAGEARISHSLTSKFGVRAGSIRVSAPLRLAGGAETRDSERGLELALLHEGRLGDVLRTEAELGTRSWSDADGRPFARLGGIWELDALSVGLDLEHTDHIDRSDSLEVLRRGLRQTGLGAHLSSQFAPRWSFWGSTRWSQISDGNTRGGLDLSLDYAPWRERDLGITFGMGAVGYADDSSELSHGGTHVYYSPKSDVDFTAGLRGGIELPLEIALRAGARTGWGRVDERDGIVERGSVGSAHLELAWQSRGWYVLLRGEYGYSARASGWHWGAALLQVERRF